MLSSFSQLVNREGLGGGENFERGASCNLNLKDEKCVVERA